MWHHCMHNFCSSIFQIKKFQHGGSKYSRRSGSKYSRKRGSKDFKKREWRVGKISCCSSWLTLSQEAAETTGTSHWSTGSWEPRQRKARNLYLEKEDCRRGTHGHSSVLVRLVPEEKDKNLHRTFLIGQEAFKEDILDTHLLLKLTHFKWQHTRIFQTCRPESLWRSRRFWSKTGFLGLPDLGRN